jgi:hypothetical protein
MILSKSSSMENFRVICIEILRLILIRFFSLKLKIFFDYINKKKINQNDDDFLKKFIKKTENKKNATQNVKKK